MLQVILCRPEPGAETGENASGPPSRAGTWSKTGRKCYRSFFFSLDLEQKQAKMLQVPFLGPGPGAKPAEHAAGPLSQVWTWSRNRRKCVRSSFSDRDLKQNWVKMLQVSFSQSGPGAKRGENAAGPLFPVGTWSETGRK